MNYLKLTFFAVLFISLSGTLQAQNFFYSIKDGKYDEVASHLAETPTLVDSTNNNVTPLMLAAYYGQEKIADLLIQNKADLNTAQKTTARTALHFAALGRKTRVIQLLLINGADINIQDNDKKNALHITAQRDDYKSCSLLIEKGVNLNLQDKNGQTPLLQAISARADRIAVLLINSGADLQLSNTSGQSALAMALKDNNKQVVNLLLKKNIELPVDTGQKNNLLHAAVLNGYQDLAHELYKNGADIFSKDSKSRTLLHKAAQGGNIVWIDKLLNLGLEVNTPDEFRRIALHYAVLDNHFEAVKRFIEADSQINIADYTNRTPLKLAHDWLYPNIADLLQRNGANETATPIITLTREMEGRQTDLKVTYTANMGYHLSTPTKNVLIDALFENKLNSYLAPSTDITNRMIEGKAPFTSTDLLLVTHGHADHCSVPLIVDFLAKNKKANIICNKQVKSLFEQDENYGSFEKQITAVTPELCNDQDTTINSVSVKVLRMRHSGGNGSTENLGYLIELDGMKIFHSGDYSGNVGARETVDGLKECDSLGIEQLDIDLAILNRGYLWDNESTGIEILQKYLRPKHIILGHFSLNDKDGEWERIQSIIKEFYHILPEITILRESMQSVIFRKNFGL